MIKGIIFDLDGVIVSTDEYHYLAWKSIADKEGIYFDRTINNRLRGVSRMNSLEIILERANHDYSEEEKIALTDQKQKVYRDSLGQLSPSDLSKDNLNTLITLKNKGYLLGIGSSSKNTKYILERIGIIDMFDFIADGTMITHSKPDPEVFLLAASGLKLNTSECVVIEDAFSGIDAGNAGGFITIGIGDASRYEKANFHINQLNEIIDIVDKI